MKKTTGLNLCVTQHDADAVSTRDMRWIGAAPEMRNGL